MALLEWFAGIRSPFWDAFFSFWSFFGEEAFILPLLCVLYWCVDKKLAYRIGLVTFISGCAVQTTKIICRIPRPWVLKPGFQPVDGALETATGYSFPSGHTQTGAAVFGATASYFGKTILCVLCGFVALMVACARMYLGVHTPADVFTALGISAVVALAIHFTKADRPDRKTDLAVSVILAILGLTAVITGLFITGGGIAEYTMTADTVKFGAATCGFAVSYYIERNYIDFSVRCRHWALNIPKALLGVAVMLAIKEGVKLISGSTAADIIRYFLVIVWGMTLYPLIIKKLFSEPSGERPAQGL